MTCKNVLCVFNKDNKCLVKEVELDERGICDNYIMVNFSKEMFLGYKKERYEKMQSFWKKEME